MNPLVSKRFRDRIKQHFGGRLFWQAPLDERAGQQNSRDLVDTRQGLYSGNIALEAPKVFPGLDATSVDFDGVTSLLRSVGSAGDFAFITEEANWQIHFFVKSDQTKTQVFLATEALSAASNIGDGFIFYEVLALPTLDKAIRLAYVRQGLANPMATTANNFMQPNRPLFFSLVRSAGVLSLFCNSVLVPWATNTIGTLSRVAPQLYPLSVGCTPAGVTRGEANAKLQHPFIVRGERPEPQGDVDFIYREAIRGMSLWDWFSQAYPTTDVFCEFDEQAGGTTLVNRAGADGTYLGGVVVENSRISARTGLSAKFFRESVSRAVLASIRCDYVQKTGVFSIFMVLQVQDAFATATRIIVRNGAYGTYIPGFRVSFNGPSQIRFLLNDGVFGSDGYTTNIGFNLGRDVSNETISIAVVGDGTGISLYLDGALRSRSTALSLVNVDGFSGVTAFTNNIAGASALSCQAGLMLITPVAMQAHEVMHLHKLTELSGYFDRPDEFLEYDITTGETPLPEPPPPSEAGFFLTEDGFVWNTEAGERIGLEGQAAPPPPEEDGNYLLKEDGDFLKIENGERIILESEVSPPPPPPSEGSYLLTEDGLILNTKEGDRIII